LTIGARTIIDARRIVTITLGAHKVSNFQEYIEGGINNMWTLSVLQSHKHSIVVADEDADEELPWLTYGQHYQVFQPFKNLSQD
jgi:glucosamine-6-phosphate deaminase